jgi:hypothetical protein
MVSWSMLFDYDVVLVHMLILDVIYVTHHCHGKIVQAVDWFGSKENTPFSNEVSTIH